MQREIPDAEVELIYVREVRVDEQETKPLHAATTCVEGEGQPASSPPAGEWE